MHAGSQILIVLTIYVLVVARVTRLINADMIFDRVRLIPVHRLRAAQDAATEARMHGQGARAELFGTSIRRWSTTVYFLGCPWCVSIWVALAAAPVPVRLIGWPWWVVIPVALAASHLVGVFAFAADTEDTEVVEDDA
jgi:Protein of unknown function (DUF1360)